VKQTNWYFEDFFPGQEIALGSRTVHVDHDAGAASIFGSVIASGWHTCSMMMRLVVDKLMSESSSMGSPGLDGVRWLLPVRAGDTLSVSYLTTKVKSSTSRADRGVVWSKWTATNQHGEAVCTIEGMGMFGRRPRAGADA
jgi:acyl dehydratase